MSTHLRRLGRASAFALVTALGTTVVAPAILNVAVAQTAKAAAVYNGTQPNTTAPVSNEVSRALRYVVTGKDGAAYESNYGSPANWTPAGQNNLSIIDLNQMASDSAFSMQVTLTNNGSANKQIVAVYSLGRSFESGTQIPNVEATGVINTSNSAGMRASFTSPNNTQVRLEGTLAPGESYTVTVPLRLTNSDTLNVRQGGYDATYTRFNEDGLSVDGTWIPDTEKIKIYARFADRVVTPDGTDYLAANNQYLGTVREENGTYVTVPESIQSLLPASKASDFTTENVFRGVPALSFNGVQSVFMANGADDTALYTGGWYYLDTTSIKNSLKGSGWSVNNLQHRDLGDTDMISDSYGYMLMGNGGLVIKDASTGEAVNLDGKRVYAELFEYIRTHPVKLKVGEAYTAADSVDFIRDYARENLALDDPRVTVDTSAVDTSKPGRYLVTFTYTPNRGESVTKTDYVIVEAEEAPQVDPTTPANDPSSPAADPTTPGTPGSHAAQPVKRLELPNTGAAVLGVGVVAVLLLVGGGVLIARSRKQK